MDLSPGTGARPEGEARRERALAAALLLAASALWTFVALRYAELSALPLHAGAVLLHVALLTLVHCLVGRSIVWLLARAQPIEEDAWAWHLLLGSGALPAVLWIADRAGVRAAGWGVLALLALAGLALALRGMRAGARPAQDRVSAAIAPLALLACLAGAAAVGLDHIVYARSSPQGIVLVPPEDNLVHAAFALEWARQVPYRHLFEGFAPERVGIDYHYLGDVQLAAWWTLCGGSHLDVAHLERFVLQGLALLAGLYLFARAILESRTSALVTVALFAALPFWFLDVEGVPQRESLQRLWISFTFQGGAAFGAGFLACLWAWLARGRSGFARLALALAGLLLLAKVYFALLAWAAAGCLVLYVRPRALAAWLGALAGLGLLLIALQPHGADIVPLRPEWAPGRFWSSLLAARDDRGLATFVEWTEVGLCVLGAGALAAALALRRLWPASADGRRLALLVGSSWGAFLAYASLFWFLDAHQTVFQFLPWLALVSILAGLAGLRAALGVWLAGKRRVATGLVCGGVALWGLVLARAWQQTGGFGKVQWTSFTFTADAWETLEYLRTQTPPAARVLAPFESALPGPLPSPYAVSAVAGRRAVNEHSGLAVFVPGVAERMAQRKRSVGEFYRDPRPEVLRELATAWELEYVILPSNRTAQLPDALGEVVFRTPQWSVLRLSRP